MKGNTIRLNSINRPDAVALHVVGQPLADLEPGERAAVKVVCESANLLEPISKLRSGSN